MKENLHRHLSLAVLFSEFSHVFCCVLPTLFTVLSFAVNLGLVSTMPGFLLDLHHRIHEIEIPIIIGSGAMLLIGWFAHKFSRKVDCHDTGCCHPPCDTKKTTNEKILIAATLLFVLNISIYLFVHRNVLELSVFAGQESGMSADSHDHEGHGHEDAH